MFQWSFVTSLLAVFGASFFFFFFCQLLEHCFTYFKLIQIMTVCWLLNVPVPCECISGTDLLRQLYVLPH